ncbi:MAG: hypothetical protein Q9169_006457, partial [Polycauliona sp. 2 TL-2023]
MPSRRVVQDSDEEDNVDESPVRQHNRVPELLSSPAGTGSTEKLKREIQNAQISLLDPSTSSRSSMPPSDTTSSSKKRAATGLEDRASKKPKVTYGGKKSHDHKVLSSDSDDEDPIPPKKQSRNTTSMPLCESRGSPTEDGENVYTGDTSMPPPVSRSSGATQQDVQYSLPSTIPNTERPSSPIVVVASKRKRAVSETSSPKITLGSEVAPSSSAPASSPVKRARRAPTRENDGPQNDVDEGHDELSLSATASPLRSRRQAKSIARLSSAKFHEMNEPDTGDLIPDIPAENYQPRPSRSRSTLTSDDVVVPTDFSRRPELLAKKKSKPKRRKGAEIEELIPPERVSTRRQQAESAEPPESGSVEKLPNDTEIDTPDVGDQVLPKDDTGVGSPPTKPPAKPSPKKSAPKKSRGRPKKATTNEENDRPSVPVSVSLDDNGPDQKPANVPAPVPAPVPAKRGRKRKKSPPLEKSSAIVHEDPPSDDEHTKTNSPVEGVLSEGDPNIPAAQSATHGAEVPETPKSEPITSMKSVTASESASKQTPVKKEEKKLAETGKDSPAGYRIGLSKRHRIAPLLRI